MHKHIRICLPHHGDELIEVDEEFECLLHELNVMELRTSEHCAGDPDTQSDSYIAFELTNCDVWVRQLAGRIRLVIRWNRYGKPLYGGDCKPTSGPSPQGRPDRT